MDFVRNEKNGRLTFASAGVGSAEHLAGEYVFRSVAGHRRDARSLSGRRSGQHGHRVAASGCRFDDLADGDGFHWTENDAGARRGESETHVLAA